MALNTEFNLGFHRPKKDQCSLCDEYRYATEGHKQMLEERYKNHLEMKDVCRLEKKVDKIRAKTEPNFASMNFDLEKVLSSPAGLNSLLYYCPKLSVYNLTIFDVENKLGLCYLWNETQAGRGSCEIASALWDWLSSLPDHVTECSIFSDTCGGQNRNKNVAAMLLTSVRLTHLQIVDQKFLESGHTEMECDSMHSTIERSLRHMKIQHPSDYVTVLAEARRQMPYKVKECDGSEVLDWKTVSSKLLINSKNLENGDQLNWLKIKHMRFMKEYPDKIFVKYDFRDEEFFGFEAKRGRPLSDNGLSEMLKTKLYSGALPISKAKHKDLIALCDKNVISEEFQPFYRNLVTSKEAHDQLDVILE